VRIQYRKSELSEGVLKGVSGGDRLPWVKFENEDNFHYLKSLNWQIHVYGKAENAFKTEIKKLKVPLIELSWSEEAKRKGLVENGFYLIRPDGYVALASYQQNFSSLVSYLNRLELTF
jgi:hypothetical protein